MLKEDNIMSKTFVDGVMKKYIKRLEKENRQLKRVGNEMLSHIESICGLSYTACLSNVVLLSKTWLL